MNNNMYSDDRPSAVWAPIGAQCELSSGVVVPMNNVRRAPCK